MAENQEKSNTTTYRVVVYEGEWTCVRHFARKLLRKQRECSQKWETTRERLKQQYQQQQEKAIQFYTDSKTCTKNFLRDYPSVVLPVIGLAVAWRSKKYFSTFASFRNGLIAAAVSSVLFYPKKTIPFFTTPGLYLRDVYRKITEPQNQDSPKSDK